MPIEYIILRYFNGTLWHLSVYHDYNSALAEFNDQKSRYNSSKVQLKKHDNGVISTLFETKGA